MFGDPSWEVMPVARPDLRRRKRRRLIRRSLASDPVGLPEPLYQLRQRDQVVMPSALDRTSRGLLIRAQSAISSALDPVVDEEVQPPDILAEPALRWHEWQIALALRDITDLRAEHEFNAASSAGPLTDSVLGPQQRALQLAQDAIESRVAALEHYAAEVVAARSAFRDLADALRISDRNDRYLGLVARPPPTNTPSLRSAASPPRPPRPRWPPASQCARSAWPPPNWPSPNQPPDSPGTPMCHEPMREARRTPYSSPLPAGTHVLSGCCPGPWQLRPRQDGRNS